MEVVLILFILIVLFVVLGISGHILSALGYVIEFLFDGCTNSLGCLFAVIFVILLICAMAM